jgi:hypothetical protein
MASGAFWLGASPGVQTLGNQMLIGPALADKAYASELKGQAETSLLMQKLRETAADAEKKLTEGRYLREAPDQLRLSAAANYGTDFPSMSRAESMIRNPEPAGLEGPRWEGSPEFATARRALGESAGGSANPDKVTLPGLSGYRKGMAEVPGEQGKSDAITSALAKIQGGNVEGAYDITGPILGHNAPREPTDSSSAYIKTLKAAGIDPASPEGQKMIREYLTKQATHPPGATLNAYGAPHPVTSTDPATGKRSPAMIVTDKKGGQQVLPNVEPYVAPPRSIGEAMARDMGTGAQAPKDPATDPKAIAIRADLRAGKLTRDQAKASLKALGYPD